MVTSAGWKLWTFRTASSPLRAVATTRNSPDSSMRSESTRRMSALSSATRTVGRSELADTMLDRLHFDLPAGKARRLLTDEVMDAIAALSGQERADAYNELPPGATGVAVGI